MCELFGVDSAKKIPLNELLREFFSDGTEHPHGWGMAFFYGNAVSLEKQPQSAVTSNYLKQRLRAKIETDKMIAHIRLATRGTMDYENTHPFVMRDNYDRTWTLDGDTDSERILCYIIDQVNAAQDEKGAALTKEERFALLNRIILEIAPENKLNLLIFDGEIMYIHTNYKDSLYRCRKDKAIVMATRPLDRDKWKNVPMNQLLAYEDGKLIYTGTKHEYEFVDSEEKMHMLFLDFANL